MKNLIKVSYKNDRQTVSARDLWEFLGRPHSEFMKWFSRYSDYGFAENTDYRAYRQIGRHANGRDYAQTDYEITIDMAKELAMLQKTEKGKMARQYFIDLEKKWNSPEALMARALKMADKKITELESKMKKEREEKQSLQLTNKKQEQIIGELKPKADYVDKILQNKGLVTITQIAKDYGMSGQTMNNLLHELDVQYNQSDQWLLYAKYHNKGYTHSKTFEFEHKDGTPDIKMYTKWTQKGRLFLYNLLKENGVLPTIEVGEKLKLVK